MDIEDKWTLGNIDFDEKLSIYNVLRVSTSVIAY